MINETINSTITALNLAGLNVSNPIPLIVTINSTTNWPQFAVTTIIGLLGIFGFMLIFQWGNIKSRFGKSYAKKLASLTGRNTVTMKHANTELFSVSMITEKTLRQLSEIMNKFKGKPFDLVLHTPGGEVFSSLAISRMLSAYPGEIRVVVPLYAMSGGTLLALSCDKLVMTPNSCLGMIDPQLGNFFKFGSARAWKEIVKMKGNKAEDSTISFAMMGKQYTNSIYNHLMQTVDFGLTANKRKRLCKFLTDGKLEHAHALLPNDLASMGLPVSLVETGAILTILTDFVATKGSEGVHYCEVKG